MAWDKENGWYAYYTQKGQIRPQGRIRSLSDGWEPFVYNGHSAYISLGTCKSLWVAKRAIVRALEG